MPFIVPRVVTFGPGHQSTTVVTESADPSPDQMEQYIHWLEDELAIAREAHLECVCVPCDSKPTGEKKARAKKAKAKRK